MKGKPLKPPAPEDVDDIPKLGTMYCTQEIGKILHTSTLVELGNFGLKEDVAASWIKISFMLLLSGVGTYSALFTSVEKSRDKLQLTVVAFFVIFVIMMIYEKLVLRGASFRAFLDDGSKVYLWCTVNWKDGTYDIAYSLHGAVTHSDTFKVPLGEIFYENGEMDEEYYQLSMAKFCDEIRAINSKKSN